MKKNVVVIFGGDSSEHDVSCLSATTVIKNMDTEKYNVILVGITKEGRWLLVDGVKDIEDGSWSVYDKVSPYKIQWFSIRICSYIIRD